MTAIEPVLGDAGVLAPGRWRWLRAIAWLLLLMAAMVPFPMIPGFVGRLLHLGDTGRNVLGAAALALMYLAYALLVRVGEKRAPGELALRPALRELATGLLIGAGMFLLVFAALRLAGLYTLAPGRWTDWAHDLWLQTTVGFLEELIARAIIFRLLMRGFGLWPALVLSSLLFGAAHLGNPNATLLGAAAIAVEAGLMLAAFFVATGRLWMPIGVHIAWNTMQGPVFGARVSGHVDTGSAFVSAPVTGAPEWLSGGGFGPEASVWAMAVGLAVFALVYRTIAQRRRI